MSTLDLQQEITRALEENPLLEREDEIEQYAESSDSDVREQETPIESVESPSRLTGQIPIILISTGR